MVEMSDGDKKLVVLTGVTYGLGRAMALRLIELGHSVLGCGRSKDKIDALRTEFPEGNDFAVVDVTDPNAVSAWAARIIPVFGPPHLLINNAALANNRAPLWEVPAEEFSRLMRVNVEGVANVIRAFVPAMVTRQSGVIVNFSSSGGRGTAGMLAPYCASKWAIEGLSKAMAKELPPQMACIPLDPGIINTNMLSTTLGDAAGAYHSPEEWSRTAVPYILSLGPKDNGRSASTPR